MQFKNVIGQDGVKQHLVEMVQHNRLSHALLFLGKEGSGALPLAMAFAQYISLLPASSKGGGVMQVSFDFLLSSRLSFCHPDRSGGIPFRFLFRPNIACNFMI